MTPTIVKPATPSLLTVLLTSLVTVLLSVLIGVLVFVAPVTFAQEEENRNLLETIAADPEFSTLEQVLRTARIEDSIAFTDNITLLAPTNDAFAGLPETVRTSLLQPENQDVLLEVLRYHVVLKPLSEEDIFGSTDLISLLGPDQNLSFVRRDDSSFVNDTVRVRDYATEPTNGTLVTIEEVLLPEGFDAGALQITSAQPTPSAEAGADAINAAATAAAESTPRTGGAALSIGLLGLVVAALLAKQALLPRRLQVSV